MLRCHSVTPPSITRWGFSRQRSLFYPSVNQHPQANSLGTSCQTTQRLPARRFAVNASALAWLRAPRSPQDHQEPSFTHLVPDSKVIPLQFFFVGGDLVCGGFRCSVINQTRVDYILFVVDVGNLQEIGSEQIPFAVLIHLAENDGSVRATSL